MSLFYLGVMIGFYSSEGRGSGVGYASSFSGVGYYRGIGSGSSASGKKNGLVLGSETSSSCEDSSSYSASGDYPPFALLLLLRLNFGTGGLT